MFRDKVLKDFLIELFSHKSKAIVFGFRALNKRPLLCGRDMLSYCYLDVNITRICRFCFLTPNRC